MPRFYFSFLRVDYHPFPRRRKILREDVLLLSTRNRYIYSLIDHPLARTRTRCREARRAYSFPLKAIGNARQARTISTVP